MTNERHEKALEAAYAAAMVFQGTSNTKEIETVISAYLQAMEAVIVPREPTREMWAAMADSLYRYKNRHHDKVVADLLDAMFSSVPNHFTNGE